MFDSKLIAFTIAVGVLTLVPGADTMLVMRNVLGRGRIAGFFTALGIGSGLFVQAIISALGLSAILMRSAQLFAVIKSAGALYLVGLGLWTVVSAWRTRGDAQPDAPVATATTVSPNGAGVWRSYAEGLFTNLLNPKIIVFYLAFLPQFIAPTDPVLPKSMLLATIHFALTIAWLSTLTLALAGMNAWISKPSVKRRLDYFTGTVLIALGARLALERP